MERETPPETPAEKLRQELDHRGQYYFKGFGIILSALISNLEIYTTDGRNEEFKTYIRNALQRMIELYESIPFNQIKEHPDYDLLREIRNAIDRLNPEIQQIFDGKTDTNGAYAILHIIHKKGQEYRARLATILRELRAQPDQEHAGLPATDVIDGKVWESAI